MKFYAERPARRFAQLITDLTALGWLAAGGWLAWWAFGQLMRLRAPGEELARTGQDISGVFADGARAAGRTPLVGDALAGALRPGVGAGAALTRAGRTQADAVATLATGTAVLVAALVLVPVLLAWLPVRWRYTRAASAAAGVRAGDTDLLALRALIHLPPRRLRTAGDRPAASWRDGDPIVCRQLADLELARLGLRGVAAAAFPPRRSTGRASANRTTTNRTTDGTNTNRTNTYGT